MKKATVEINGKKKHYLVKCDERHEVELIDGRYNFCALGHLITPAVAVLLGYVLQEVKEPLVWEGEVLCGGQSTSIWPSDFSDFPSEFKNKRFRARLEEVVE